MKKLEKSRLVIAVMALIAGYLFLSLTAEQMLLRTDAFSQKEEVSVYPKLMAPERTVFPLAEGQRVCYLTFDDGPSDNTEKILDILNSYGIHATFFVIGDSLTEERRETLERIVLEGHSIGMHANVHEYEKLYAGLSDFLEDYEILYQKLKEEYGIETAIFRMPGGSVCSCLYGKGKEYIREMEARGFTCFDWNVSGEDSVGNPTVSSIQNNVLRRGLECRRAIVLLHDSKAADKTVEALPGIIEAFLKKGFGFDSLEHAESYIFPASRNE